MWYTTPVARRGLWLRSLLYVALVLGLSNLLVLDAVDRALLAPARLAIASGVGALLSLVLDGVRVIGERVYVGLNVVEVVNSCTGVDVAIFLGAAMLVYPAPWRARALGIAAAFALVIALNFVRVATLCVLNAISPRAFELVHVYVWPAFIAAFCLATLLLWIQSVERADA